MQEISTLNSSQSVYSSQFGHIPWLAAVQRFDCISAIYSVLVQKISTRFYHIEWSKVKEIEILIKIKIQPIQHGGYEILRQMIIDHVVYIEKYTFAKR